MGSSGPRPTSPGLFVVSSFMGRDEREAVKLRKTLEAWPVLRQLRGADRLGLGEAARSPRSARLAPRTADADKVVASVCPYCAVGCGQKVYDPSS
jgi:Molybdopterin oxidoreductase Fe4S4 domain